MPAHRIVSLIASATEIVTALGCGDQLVGRSHECDFPPSVTRLPACSSSKIRTGAPSRAIDTQVRSIVANGLSVYAVDASRLDELAPTVIVTQTQCEVCAVSLEDVQAAVCAVVGSRPSIVSLEPMSLADIWKDIRRVAAALGQRDEGETLVTQLTRRLDDLRARIKGLTGTQAMRPTVACLEWTEPLMYAANWVPDLVAVAGGANLFGDSGVHSGYLTVQQLAAAQPDVIVVMPCGFDLDRTCQEMSALTSRPEWRALSAVRQGQVAITDGNQYFNRPGPRVVESAEILAEVLHPGLVDFGHAGTAWTWFSPAGADRLPGVAPEPRDGA